MASSRRQASACRARHSALRRRILWSKGSSSSSPGRRADFIFVKQPNGDYNYSGLTQAQGSPSELWFADEVVPCDPRRDGELIGEAVQTAQKADVVLLVLGDDEQTCREGWSAQHLGDRDSLDLPGRQEDLLRAVYETGKPVILLLIQVALWVTE